jgi:hypothetical protein
MNRQTLAALVVLNIVLLVALVVVGPASTPVAAQGFGQQQYIMVSGQAVGRQDQNAIYVIEVSSGRIAALLFHSADNRLEIITGRDIRPELGR